MENTEQDQTALKDKPKKRQLKPPSKYAVVLYNDNYTPMDFVVFVLQEIFDHPFERAERIMLAVHTDGMGVAGIYHFEIAEQKAYDTVEEAQQNLRHLPYRQ